MDQDRWPEAVVKFVDGVGCPQCAALRERIMVTVRYSPSPPMWVFTLNCPGCNTMHRTEWLDLFGVLRPKPETVPLPEWAVELAKEMR